MSVFWVSEERWGELPATSRGWPGAGGTGWPALGECARGSVHYQLVKEIQ